MSQRNVDIARRCYEVLARRDWPAVPEVFGEAFVFDLSRSLFSHQVFRGLEGLREYVTSAEEILDDFVIDPSEFIDVGDDKVVAVVTIRGRGKHSQIDVDRALYNVLTLGDGMVTRIDGGYVDREEALRDAGAPGQSG